MTSFEDMDAGHGRVETHKCKVTGDLSHISKPDHWEKLQTIVRIDSERYTKTTGVTKNETRYYISCVAPDPKALEKVIQSHLGIESKLHWHLDVSVGEDRGRKRDRKTAENYPVILRMALKLVANLK